MPWTPDSCSDLQAHCVAIPFRNLCIGEPVETQTVQGSVSIRNADSNLQDPAGIYFLSCPKVQTLTPADTTVYTEGECEYLLLKTCALPANTDADYDPETPESINRALTTTGTYYNINAKVGGKDFSFDFSLDAAETYTEIDGCVPINQVDLTNTTETETEDEGDGLERVGTTGNTPQG